MNNLRVFSLSCLLFLLSLLSSSSSHSSSQSSLISPFLLSVSAQLPQPVITDVDPVWILPNTNVTIRGYNFDPSMNLYFNYVNIPLPDNVLYPAFMSPPPFTSVYQMDHGKIWYYREHTTLAPYYMYYWLTCGVNSGTKYYYVSSSEVICTVSSADPYLNTLTSKMIFAYGAITSINRFAPGQNDLNSRVSTGVTGVVSDVPDGFAVGFYVPAFNAMTVSPPQGGVTSNMVPVKVTLLAGYNQTYFDQTVTMQLLSPQSQTIVFCDEFTFTDVWTFNCSIPAWESGRWRFFANMSNGYQLLSPDTPATSFTAWDHFDTIWDSNAISASYSWVKTGGQASINPSGSADRTFRFNVKASNIILDTSTLTLRFYPGSYTLDYVTIGFGYNGNPDVYQQSLQTVTFPNSPAKVTSVGYVDSNPFTLCVSPQNTIPMNMPQDLVITIHVTQSSVMPYLSGTTTDLSYVWTDANYQSAIQAAAGQPTFASLPGSHAGYATQWNTFPPAPAPPMTIVNNAPVFGLAGIFAINRGGSCPTIPVINSIYPPMMLVNAVNPTVFTITGSGFSNSNAALSTATYGLVTSPQVGTGIPLPASQYVCGSPTVLSDSVFLCTVSNTLPYVLGQYLSFQVTVTSSSQTNLQLSLPSNALILLNDNPLNVNPNGTVAFVSPDVWLNMTVKPSNGPITPPSAQSTYPPGDYYIQSAVTLNWISTAPTSLTDLVSSGNATIGYLTPPTNAYSTFTPCKNVVSGGTTYFSKFNAAFTRYACYSFNPTIEGKYVFMVLFNTGLNLTAPQPFGSYWAFNKYNRIWDPPYPTTADLVTPKYTVTNTNGANAQIYNQDPNIVMLGGGQAGWVNPPSYPEFPVANGGTVRSILPQYNLLNPSTGIQIQMYAGSKGLVFDSVSIGFGLAPSPNYMTSAPIPVTFNNQPWYQQVYLKPGTSVVSDPIFAFCYNHFLDSPNLVNVTYDLLVTFHVANNYSTSLLFYNTSFSTPSKAQSWYVPDPVVNPTQYVAQAQWDIVPTLQPQNGTFVYQVFSLDAPSGLVCPTPVVKNITVQSILKNQPLFVTLSGANFNLSSSLRNLATYNQGTPAAPIVSYYLVNGTSNRSYLYGNASVCRQLTLVDDRTITCSMTDLTALNFNQSVAIMVYAYGQLSGPFIIQLLAPTSPQITTSLLISPASGLVRAPGVGVALLIYTSIGTSKFVGTSLGYDTPDGRFVPCANFSFIDANYMNCTIYPSLVGVYQLQVGFTNGINITTFGTLQAYTSYATFTNQYSNAANYPLAQMNYTTASQSVGAAGTYRFPLPRNFVNNLYNQVSTGSGSLVVRLQASPVAYSFSYMSLAFGIAGRPDILPSTTINVTFALTSAVSGQYLDPANPIAYNVATGMTVPPNIQIDSNPVPFCLRPGGATTTAQWEIIVTFYSTSTTLPALVKIPSFNATTAVFPAVKYADTTLNQAFRYGIWSTISPAASNLGVVAVPLIDSVWSVDNVAASCVIPTVTAVNPPTGFGNTNQTVTLTGTNFAAGMLVQYGVIGLASPPGYGSACVVVSITSTAIVCNIGSNVAVFQSIQFVVIGQGTQVSSVSTVTFAATPYPVLNNMIASPMSGPVGQNTTVTVTLSGYTDTYLNGSIIGYFGNYSADGIGFVPCKNTTWLPNRGGLVFTCIVNPSQPGWYNFQVFYNKAVIPYNITSSGRLGSFAAYTNFAPSFRSSVSYPSTQPEVTYTWQMQGFNTPTFYRFAVPTSYVLNNTYAEGIVLRLAAMPVAYNFERMTIGWGTSVSAAVLPNTVQNVTFLNYPNDKPVFTTPLQQLDSNPIVMCLPPGNLPYSANNNYPWVLIVTFHTNSTAVPFLFQTGKVTGPNYQKLYNSTVTSAWGLADTIALYNTSDPAVPLLVPGVLNGWVISNWDAAFAQATALNQTALPVQQFPYIASMLIDSVYGVSLVRSSPSTPYHPFNLDYFPNGGLDPNPYNWVTSTCQQLLPTVNTISPPNVVAGQYLPITLNGNGFFNLSWEMVFHNPGSLMTVPDAPMRVMFGLATDPLMSYSNSCNMTSSSDGMNLNCTIDSKLYPVFSFLNFYATNGHYVSNVIAGIVSIIPDYNMWFLDIQNIPPVLNQYRPGYLFLNSTPTALLRKPLNGQFDPSIFNYTLYLPYVTQYVKLEMYQQYNDYDYYWSTYGVQGPTTFDPVFGVYSRPAINTVTAYNFSAKVPVTLGPLVNSMTVSTSNLLTIFTPMDSLTYTIDMEVAPPDMLQIVTTPFPQTYLAPNSTLFTQPSSFMMPSNFSSNQLVYVLNVTYVCTSVNITVYFKTLGSVNVFDFYNGGDPGTYLTSFVNTTTVRNTDYNAPPPVSNTTTYYISQTLTFNLAPAPAYNYFVVNSQLDGRYSFNISRAPPDVQLIKMFTSDVFGASNTDTNFPFVYGVLTSPTYKITVPYRVNVASFNVTANTNNTIFVSMDTPSTDMYGQPIAADPNWNSMYKPAPFRNLTDQYPLRIGTNVFRITSLLDGNYTVVIQRSLPDFQSIVFTGNDFRGNVVPIPFPGYRLGVYTNENYTLNVPRNIYTINVTMTYSTPYSVVIDVNRDFDSTLPIPGAAAVADLSGINTPINYQLIIGSNLVRIVDSFDGTYLINLVRMPSDMLTDVSIRGWMPSTNSFTSDLVSTPVFKAGVTTQPYNIYVNFLVWNITVNVTFFTPNSMTYDLNNGVVSLKLNSSVVSPKAELLIGMNVIKLTSIIDGIYIINIYRSGPDIQLLQWTPDTYDLTVVGALNYEDEPDNWQSYQYVYNATVYFSSFKFSPLIQFNTANSIYISHVYPTLNSNGSTVYLTTPQYPILNNPNMVPGVVQPAFNMTVGLNILRINSTLDGTYSLYVTRLPPDLISVDIRGQTTNGTVTDVNFSPPFSSNLNSYTLTLNYKFVSISLRVVYNTPSTVNVTTTDVNGKSNLYPTQSGVYTPYLPIYVGKAAIQFVINSALDGLYTVSVVRSIYNLINVLVIPQQTIPLKSPGAALSYNNYQFTPGIYNYTANCDFILTSFDVKIYQTLDTDNTTLEYWTVDPVTGKTNYIRYNPVLNNVPVTNFALGVGLNTLRVTSNNDGVFTFLLYRRKPDLTFAAIVGLYPNTTLTADAKKLNNFYTALSPPYQPGIFTYTLLVPYKIQSINVYVTYNDPTDYILVDYLLPNQLPDPSYNNSLTGPFALVGNPIINNVWITVRYDGVYSIQIVRNLPDVLDLLIYTHNITGQSIGQLPIYSASATNFPATAVIKPTNTSLAGFIRGTMLYTAQVPYSQPWVTVRARWNSTVDIMTVDSGDGTVRSVLVNNTRLNDANKLFLTPGVTNLIYVRSSLDGAFVIAIARGNLTFAIANNPRTLFAKGSSAILVNLIGGIKPVALGGTKVNLLVNISTTVGTVYPSLLDFSGLDGYGDINSIIASFSFTLQAPDVLTSNRVALVTFGILGGDSWQIDPGVPPAINVTMIPTNVTSLGAFFTVPQTIPATVLINSTTTNMQIVPSISGQPDINNTLSVKITCSSGSVAPNILTFNRLNWFSNQSFTYFAPNYLINVTCSFNLSGYNWNNNNNPQQYIAPASIAINVLGVITLQMQQDSGGATAVSVNPPPNVYYLYANQVSQPIFLTPFGKVNPSMQLTITTPNGGAGNSLVISPTLLTWNGWNNPIAPSYDPLSPPDSTAYAIGQSFTIQSITAQTITSSFYVIVNFAMSAVSVSTSNGDFTFDDSYSYVPPSTQLFVILPQSTLTVTGLPVTLYLNQYSNLISIVPLALPNAGGSLRVRITPSAGTVSPPFVTLLASSVLAPMQFQYQAPNTPQVVTITYSIEGSDAAHYNGLPSQTITIIPLASMSLSGAPLSVYTSQKVDTLTLVSSLLPTTGVTVSVSLQTLNSAGTAASAAGYLSQSVFTFSASLLNSGLSINSILRQSFTVVAPINPGSLVLSFTLTGTDSALFAVSLPSVTITILESTKWSIVGLPSAMEIQAVRVSYSFSIAPTSKPLGTVTITPNSPQTNAGYFQPATLTFNNTNWGSQNVTYYTPSFPSTITVQYGIGGNSAGAFTQPTSSSVIFYSPIYFQNIPSSLYANQKSSAISISLQEASPSANAALVYPFTISLSCNVMVNCTVYPSQLVIKSVLAAQGMTFTVTAPNIVPSDSTIMITAAIVSSNGVAANYFSLPQSPFAIYVQPQASFTVVGPAVAGPNFNVYAYSTIDVLITPTVAPTIPTTLQLSVKASDSAAANSVSLGTVSPQSLTFLNGQIQSQVVTYTAPNYPLAAQLIPISIVASTTNTDVAGAPQFQIPTLTLNMKGPQIIAICSPSQNVIITGFRMDMAYLNGIYTAAQPFNSNAHYSLSTYDFYGNPVTAHLFYYIDTLTGYDPSAWMIDTQITDLRFSTAYVNTDSSAPFSSKWIKRESTGLTSDASMLSVSCSSDCANLGTSASLETQVCFNRQPLLGSPAPPMPTGCPLSCARYLPYLKTQCDSTPFYRQAAVSTPLNTLASYDVCGKCNFTFTAQVMQTCGITLTGSDLTQDLATVMQLPTQCFPDCAAVYMPFYTNCIVTQGAPIPARFAAFNALCTPASAPTPVINATAVDTTETTANIAWTQPIQLQLVPHQLLYGLEMGSFSTGPFVSIYNGTLNSYQVGALYAGTSYYFRVKVSNDIGSAPYYSPVIVATTRPSPPAPPSAASLTYSTPFSAISALNAGFVASFGTTFSWAASSSGFSDTQYQLSLMASTSPLTAVIPVYDPKLTIILYTGSATSFSYRALLPGTWYRILVSASRTNTRWSSASTRDFQTTQLTPLQPTFVPISYTLLSPTASSDVTSQSVKLSWPHVFNCGASDCSDASYVIEVQNNGLTQTNKAAGISSSTPTSRAWQSPAIYTQVFTSIDTSAASILVGTANNVILTFTYFGVAPGTDYAFRISAVNRVGASAYSYVTVSTPGVLPSVRNMPTLTALSSTTVQAYWNSSDYFFFNGYADLDEFHFNAIPQGSNTGNLPLLDIYVPASQMVYQTYSSGASGFTFLMTGFNPATYYQITMEVRNAVGWSNLIRSPLQLVFVPDTPPKFISFVAKDPTLQNSAFAAGDIMVATFDKATNTPALNDQASIDSFFQFSAPIPALYVGVWSDDATQFLIYIQSVTAAATSNTIPAIGVFTARVVGSLLNAARTSTDLKSEPQASTLQVLLGTWGSKAVAASTAPSLLPYSTIPQILQESVDFYPLGLPTNPASVFLNSTAVSITVRCSNCLLSYPFYPGRSSLLATQKDGGTMQRANTFTLSSYVLGSFINPNAWANPLLQFSYTPNPYFSGVDVIVVTLQGGTAAAGVSVVTNYPIRVLPVNHAPVLSVPNVAASYNVFTRTGVTLAGLSLTDYDSIYNTPISVTLSNPQSRTSRFTLSTSLPTVGITCNIMTTQQSTDFVTITGYYPLVQAFLGQVLFSDYSIDTDASAPIIINVQANDLGSNIAGAQPLTANAQYVFQPTCVGATAPVLQSAQFSNDLTSVLLTFDGPLKLVFPVGVTATSTPLSTTSCTLYVDDATLAKLGDTATSSCFQSAPNVLTFRLGLGNTVTLATTLTLNPFSTMIRRCSSALTFAAVGSVGIAAPSNMLQPSVVLQAPATIGACQDLVLSTLVYNVSSSASATGLGAVTFVWNVQTTGGVNIPNILPDVIPASTASLTVRSALLLGDTSYRFSVSVINSIGVASPASYVFVRKATRAIASLIPVSPLTLTSSFADSLQLSARASLPSDCVNTLSVAQQQVSYQWSVTPAITLDPVSSITPTLVIPANSLKPASSYSFTLNAQLGTDTLALSYLKFNVTTLQTQTAITPSATTQVAPTGANIVVPFVTLPTTTVAATSSSPATISWICTIASTGLPCYNATTNLPLGIITSTTASPQLLLNAGTLAANNYVFTAYTPLSADTTSGLSAPAATVALTVSTASGFPQVQLKATSLLINPDDPLIVRSRYFAADGHEIFPLSNKNVSYTYLWSVTNSLGGSFAQVFQDSTVTTGQNTPVLSMNVGSIGDSLLLGVRKDVFPRGATIKLRLTVTDTVTTNSGFAEINIVVRSPPTGGSFTVSPTSGMSQATPFSVTTSGWIGSSALSYHYTVSNYLDNSSIPFGVTSGTPTDADTVYVTGDPNNNYLLQLSLTVSDLSGSRTTISQLIQVTPNTFLNGLTVQSATARVNLMSAKVATLVNTQSIPELLAYINSQASVQSYQSANITGTATPGLTPRCAGVTTFSAAVQWTPPTLVDPTQANYLAVTASVSTSAAATLVSANAAALASVTALINAAQPYLSASTSGLVSAGTVISATSSINQAVDLCNNFANNAAVASSLTLVTSLVSMCSTTLTNALTTSQLLCTISAPGCLIAQATLLRTIITASISLWELQFVSASTTASIQAEAIAASTRRRLLGVAEDTYAFNTFTGLINAAIERYTTNQVLQAVGQVISVPDCQYPVAIRRDNVADPVYYQFALDGSSVSLPPVWVSPTNGPLAGMAATDINASAIDSRFSYSLINDFSWALNSPKAVIITGIMNVSRTVGTATSLAVAVPFYGEGNATALSMTMSLKFDTSVCATDTTNCVPQCVVWSPSTRTWLNSSDTASLSYRIATRFPSTRSPSAGYVDCLVYGASTITVSAKVAVRSPSDPGYITSSTGANGGGNSGTGGAGTTGTNGGTGSTTGSNNGGTGSNSGTGSNNYGSSSTGAYNPDSSICATCFGPLGAAPPPVSTLPSPTNQLWAVNATVKVTLNSNLISTALFPKLASDLATSASIASNRIEIYSMVPGSIIASFYIYPSTDSTVATPAQAFSNLYSQSQNASSILYQGYVTGWSPNFTTANYFPSTLCSDGTYRSTCPVVSSSSSTGATGISGQGIGGTGASSSTGPIYLTDTSSSSSKFPLSGTDLLVFILALAIGLPLICLLVCILVVVHRRRAAQAEKEKQQLEQMQADKDAEEKKKNTGFVSQPGTISRGRSFIQTGAAISPSPAMSRVGSVRAGSRSLTPPSNPSQPSPPSTARPGSTDPVNIHLDFPNQVRPTPAGRQPAVNQSDMPQPGSPRREEIQPVPSPRGAIPLRPASPVRAPAPSPNANPYTFRLVGMNDAPYTYQPKGGALSNASASSAAGGRPRSTLRTRMAKLTPNMIQEASASMFITPSAIPKVDSDPSTREE